MNEFIDDKLELTDIQEGLRDVIRYHEDLRGILRNLQEEIDTIVNQAPPTIYTKKIGPEKGAP